MSVTEVRHYVALGDSFTAGAPQEREPVTWADGLARWLARGDSEWEFHRLARANTGYETVVMRQLPVACELAPHLVTVCCGGADVLGSFSPSVHGHAEAVEAILAALRRARRGVRVVTLTYPDFGRFLPYRPRTRARVDQGIATVNDNMRTIAARYDAVCVDLQSTMTDRRFVADDGIHLSSAGHAQVLRTVTRAIRDIRENAHRPSTDVETNNG